LFDLFSLRIPEINNYNVFILGQYQLNGCLTVLGRGHLTAVAKQEPNSEHKFADTVINAFDLKRDFLQLMDGSSDEDGRHEEESGQEGDTGVKGLLLHRGATAVGGNRRRNKTAGAGGNSGGGGGGSLSGASTSEARILCRICGDSAVR